MKLEKKEVKTYITNVLCENCGTVMVHNNDDTMKNLFIGFGSTNKLCKHVCPSCGYEENLDAIYPKLTYEYETDK